MLCTPYSCAMLRLVVDVDLHDFVEPLRIAAIVSTIGDTCRQGPHHGAQKSTITGSSLCSTSASHCAVVTDGTSSTGSSGTGSSGRSPA